MYRKQAYKIKYKLPIIKNKITLFCEQMKIYNKL